MEYNEAGWMSPGELKTGVNCYYWNQWGRGESGTMLMETENIEEANLT